MLFIPHHLWHTNTPDTTAAITGTLEQPRFPGTMTAAQPGPCRGCIFISPCTLQGALLGFLTLGTQRGELAALCHWDVPVPSLVPAGCHWVSLCQPPAHRDPRCSVLSAAAGMVPRPGMWSRAVWAVTAARRGGGRQRAGSCSKQRANQGQLHEIAGVLSPLHSCTKAS